MNARTYVHHTHHNTTHTTHTAHTTRTPHVHACAQTSKRAGKAVLKLAKGKLYIDEIQVQINLKKLRIEMS